LAVGALVTAVAGCARVGVREPPPAPAAGWIEEGVASWYGEPFHGRQTASGEVYDMEALTAAHRTLPFGTVVQVENLLTGARVVLRINDRGPFARGRVLDVSRRAARELDLIGPGTARVRITVLTPSVLRDCWEVQAGAFVMRENAEGLRARLDTEGQPTRVVTGAEGLHRVRVGPLANWNDAGRLAARLDGLVLGCPVTSAPAPAAP
jgi:rare lipoprotein A